MKSNVELLQAAFHRVALENRLETGPERNGKSHFLGAGCYILFVYLE